MARMQPSSTASRFVIPDAFWHGLEHLGLKPAVVLRQAKLPSELHLRERRQRQVRTDEFFRLWEAIAALTSEPAAGLLLATRLDTAVLPPSSFVAFIARDYREGLHRLARFKRLCAPERVMVAERGRECRLTIEWLEATGSVPALLVDASFASFLELGRRGTGIRIRPRRVDLARPDDGSDVHADYFGCTVRFGCRTDAIVLDVADLDRPFPGHNPELLAMLSPALAEGLADATAPVNVSQQVRVSLKRILPSGRPEMGEVARDLGMSERTLQRRITEEGTSFRQLLLETRKDVGRQLLRENVDVNDVAGLLGYDDTNSFYRAFRSWEGTTPLRWRELGARG